MEGDTAAWIVRAPEEEEQPAWQAVRLCLIAVCCNSFEVDDRILPFGDFIRDEK